MSHDKSAKKIVIVRRKKVAAGGHHGGSWKVAYADFVTAMMAFFMVMWILGMDEKLKQAIEGYFSNPVGYKKGAGGGVSPISSGNSPTKLQQNQLRMIIHNAEKQRFGDLSRRIKEAVAASEALSKLRANVEVVVAREGLRIELVESGEGDLFFPIGSAEMKPDAALALMVIAPELRALTNPVVIEGHTDAARFGRAGGYGNWELSGDRANAARRVLERHGLPSTRVTEVRGLADRHLRLPGAPLSPANRRITILIPYSQLPEGDEVVAPGGSVAPSVAPPPEPRPVT
jgi:chemotaxis protein MotB